MTTLLTAKTGGTLLDEILSRAAKRASLWPDRRLFLIVPESLKADVERRYLERFADGLMMAEVLSFRRLGYRLFSEAGGLAVKRLTPSAFALIVGRTLSEEKERFPHLAAYGSRAGYAVALAGQLDELARYRIGSGELRDVASSMPSGRAKMRLSDLAELSDAVIDKVNAAGYAGSSDDTARLLALLEANEPRLSFLKQTEVFIFGFGEIYPFNEDELALIRALSARVESLTVALALGAGESYAVARRSEMLLGRVLTYKTETVKENEISEPVRRLVTAGNERTAALSAAGYVRELSLAGVRRRDIAVACLGPDSEKMMAESLAQFCVPAFLDDETPLETTSFSRLIDAVLSLAEHQDTLDDVMRFLDNPLSGVNKDAADKFEFVCRRMRLGRLRTILEDYPKSEGMAEKETGEEKGQENKMILARLEAAADLGRRLRRAVGGAKKAALLSEFLRESGIYDVLEARIAFLVEQGETFRATALARSANEWNSRLDEAGELLGNARLAQARFNRILREAIRVKSVKNIPVGIDRVRVAPLTQLLSYPCDVLILVGVSSDTYPLAGSPDTFLTKEERAALAARMDNGFAAGASDRRLSGLAVDRAACTLPKKEFVVFMTEENVDTMPAALRDALDWPKEEVDERRPGRHWATLEEAKRQLRLASPAERDRGEIGRWKQAVEALSANTPFLTAPDERYRRAEAAELSSDRIDSAVDLAPVASVSTLQLYNACPFRFFGRHLLRLFPWEEEEPDALMRGSFLHGVLQKTVADLVRRLQKTADPEKALSAWQADLDAGGLDRAIEDVAKQPELSSLYWEGNDVRYGDRLREVLDIASGVIAATVSEMDQQPIALEWTFPGDAGNVLEWEAGGKTHRFSGVIDRVDQIGVDGFLLVDYKSSPYVFRRENVLLGTDLQLPLYQKAWQEAHPAMEPQGFDYIGLLPKTPVRDGAAGIADIGERLKEIKKNRVNDPGLSEIAEQVAKETLGRLMDGAIGALPAESSVTGLACRFCEYKAACGLKSEAAKRPGALERREEIFRLASEKESGEDHTDDDPGQGQKKGLT